MRNRRYLFTLFLLLAVSCAKKAPTTLPSSSDAEEKSPKAVVLQWIEVYGEDLDRASDLTTLEFRDNKTKKAWADKTSSILKSFKYKHLGGKIIAEKVNGDYAVVILDARIDTIAGGAKQKELYELKRIDGKWLINDIVVKEEELEDKNPYGKKI